MKAAWITAYGGPEVIKYETAPDPTAGDGEVLIKVYAAGVNPVDWKIRLGYLRGVIDFPLPLVLGGELAGVVAAVGPGVDGLQVGDEVYSHIGLTGAFAEYAVVKAPLAVRKPSSLDFVQAASIPLAATTAYQALFETGELRPKQRVLIHGAAGGVGGFAVQMAHNAGAYVIGTCSAANEAYVRGLGADETVDYRNQRFEDVARDVDLVFDLVGGETADRSWTVVKKGGLIVSAGLPPDSAKAEAAGARGASVRAMPNPRALADFAKQVDGGALKTHVEAVYPLDQVPEAQERSQAGHVRGKLVIKIAE